MLYRTLFYLFSLMAAVMLLVACGGAEPTPTPTATPQPAQPTFTPTAVPQEPATTAALPSPTLAAVQNTPAPAAFALPAPLYYIDQTSGQIMRMERDARTMTQLTNEGASITDFDVAPVSGDLVYVTNNSLVQTDASGGNRIVKLQGPSLIDDGSPNPFPGVFVRSPRFSPDGQYIVFGLGNLYLMAAGPATDYQTLIPAVVEAWGTQEFSPASWSPDGQRLLVYGSTSGGPGLSFIYTLAAGTTLPLRSPIQDQMVWGADGRTLYATGASLGFIYEIEPGLARIDAASGNVTKLLRYESAAPSASGTLAAAAHAGDDGRLQAYTASYTNSDSPANAPSLPPFALHTVDTVTGALTPIVAPPLTTEQLSSASWAPGGLGLVYLDQVETIMVPGGVLQSGRLFWAGVGENSARLLGVAGSAPRWLRETYSPFLTPIAIAAAISPPQPAALQQPAAPQQPAALQQPAAPQQPAAVQANVPDRIVDNRDLAVEKHGLWFTGRGGRDYGGDCLWTPPNGGSLTVRPQVPVGGFYKLSVWSCGDPNYDQAIYPMQILASESDLYLSNPSWSLPIMVNPNQMPGQWMEMGAYYLEPDGLVQVYASSLGNAVFDAVRFSYQPALTSPVPAPTAELRTSNHPPSPLEQIAGQDFRMRLNRYSSQPQFQVDSLTFDDCNVFPRSGCTGQRDGYRVTVTWEEMRLVYNISGDYEFVNLEPDPLSRDQQWLYLEGSHSTDPATVVRAYRYTGGDGSWNLSRINTLDPANRGGDPAGTPDGALLEAFADRYGIIDLQTPEGLTLRLYGRGRQMEMSDVDRAALVQMVGNALAAR